MLVAIEASMGGWEGRSSSEASRRARYSPNPSPDDRARFRECPTDQSADGQHNQSAHKSCKHEPRLAALADTLGHIPLRCACANGT